MLCQASGLTKGDSWCSVRHGDVGDNSAPGGDVGDSAGLRKARIHAHPYATSWVVSSRGVRSLFPTSTSQGSTVPLPDSTVAEESQTLVIVIVAVAAGVGPGGTLRMGKSAF